MTDMITYSLLEKLRKSSDLVEQLRIILTLCKMYNVKFDEETANQVLVNLPMALKIYAEIRNSDFIRDIPPEVSENIANAEKIYRDLLARLHAKVKIPIQVL